MGDTGVVIRELPAGMPYVNAEGDGCVALEDSVMLEVQVVADVRAQLMFSPDEAVKVSRALAASAGRIVGNALGEDGRAPGLFERLARMNRLFR